MSENEKDDVETYGDEYIASYHGGNVPGWLKFNYAFWIAWGIVWFFLYWNGSWGFLDRGYWHQLQRAANTTFPIVNQLEEQQPPENQE